MKKTLILIFLGMMFVIFSSSIRNTGISDYISGEVLVKFQSGITEQSAQSALSGIRAERIQIFDRIKVWHLKLVDGQNVAAAIDQLENLPIVEYAEPNHIYRTCVESNDRHFISQWGLHNTGQTNGVEDADIDAPEAWDVQTGDGSAIIGIIDTGVDYRHEDVTNNIWTNPGEDAWTDPNNPSTGNGIDDDGNGRIDDWKGWNFITETNNPMDDHGHGTHCAGIIGAEGNNDIGIAGVNWNVKIVPLKFLAASGEGTTSDAIKAILYAIDMGVDILSNSWGGSEESQALRETIAQADEAGILFVAAAGNDGINTDVYPHYPSGYDLSNIVSVASSDDEDKRSLWGDGGGGGGTGCGSCGLTFYGDRRPYATPGSNYGATSVDLAAPGSGIYSTVLGGYDSMSGTSMAAPFVAGVAGLLKIQYPALTHLEIKQVILQNTDHISDFEGKSVTEGRLNAFNAVTSGTLLSSR